MTRSDGSPEAAGTALSILAAMNSEPTRGLHARLTEEAWQGWRWLAEATDLPVTAVIEAIGRTLATDLAGDEIERRRRVAGLHLDRTPWDGFLDVARRVHNERLARQTHPKPIPASSDEPLMTRRKSDRMGVGAIIVLDAENDTFVDATDAALALYGYTRGEWVGLPAGAIFAEPDPSRHEVFDRVAAGEVVETVRHHRRKDGTTFLLSIVIQRHVLRGRPVLVGSIHPH